MSLSKHEARARPASTLLSGQTRRQARDRPARIIRAGGLLALLAVVLIFSPGLNPAVGWEMRGRPLGLPDPRPLQVGIDASYPPFAFVDADGQLRGLEVDLVDLLARELGVYVAVHNADFGNGLEALVVGQYDLALAGLVPSRDQAWQVWFSEPYFEAGAVLVGPAEKLVRALDGVTVAAERGSTAATALARMGARVHVLASLGEAVAAVEHGRAEVMATDRATALRLQANHAGWAVSAEPLVSEPLTIASPRRNRDLHHAVDSAILRLREQGYLEMLEQRWLGRSAEQS